MTTGRLVVLTEQEAEERHYRLLYDRGAQDIERRAMRMPQEINPDGGGDCGYYAVANLYMLCGLTPPSIASMKQICPPHPDGGLGLAEMIILLTEMGFPGLVSFGSLPMCETWESFLPCALASGRRFILGYQDISPLTSEQCMTIGDKDFEGISHAQIHAIVPFAAGDYGVKVITSWPEQVISLLYWDLYPTLPIHAWRARDDIDFRSRRGLMRDFVMIESLEGEP